MRAEAGGIGSQTLTVVVRSKVRIKVRTMREQADIKIAGRVWPALPGRALLLRSNAVRRREPACARGTGASRSASTTSSAAVTRSCSSFPAAVRCDRRQTQESFDEGNPSRLAAAACAVAALAATAAASAHPSVYTSNARTGNPPVAQERYVVANHGFTYVLTESNGKDNDFGVMDYKFMPTAYRNTLDLDDLLAEGDTGAQAHATCWDNDGVPDGDDVEDLDDEPSPTGRTPRLRSSRSTTTCHSRRPPSASTTTRRPGSAT